ncbi:MAG: hypothetical protein AAFZ15_28180 [Bacteroidota bacterium]
MEKILIFFSLLFCLSACGDQTSSSTPNTQSIDLSGFTVTDLDNGYQHVMKSDPNGKVLEEGTIKNGKRNGTWVIYNDRRPLPRSVANFVDDVYSGAYMEYSNTGQLELVCRYKNNQLHGRFIRVKNTRLLEEGNYVNGKIDGNYIKYYPNKDIAQQEVNYKMDKLHGASKYFNEEGELIMEYEYRDGEKVSGGLIEKKEEGSE